jgi:hypothetical protein
MALRARATTLEGLYVPPPPDLDKKKVHSLCNFLLVNNRFFFLNYIGLLEMKKLKFKWRLNFKVGPSNQTHEK